MKLFALLPLLASLAACDAGISGSRMENQPPRTFLSVRDTSLVGQITDQDRLTSNVRVSWSGTDPDGFVVAYELRYYPSNQTPAPEQGWTRTTRLDTLLLLPITRGSRFANVAVEVRAIDNEGAKDPAPARTVFPIRNSPPTLTMSRFESPPDTTFTVFSFSFDASDPEGVENIARIEVALNDSTNFVALPPDVRYITLVGEVNRADATQTLAEARVFTGRNFQPTQIRLPNLRLDARNVFYARAVDQTDTTSATVRYPALSSPQPWFVKKPNTRVLVVNDYRNSASPTVLRWHLDVLRGELGYTPDVWNVERPYATGSNPPNRSPLLGPTQEPALRETFALFDRIYWVSTATTNSATRNNLPFAAPAFSRFFQNGGRMIVHSPIALPPTTELEENLDNPALFVLPISALIPLPDSLRSLIMSANAPVRPQNPLPGVGALPALRSTAFVITTLPYQANDTRTIPLYEAQFQYQTRVGNRRGIWTGPSVVASLRLDALGEPSVALMSLPLVNESNGQPLFVGQDGNTDAGREAVRMMLRSLGF